jgi:thymidylate synthase
MNQYKSVLRQILQEGTWEPNARTGIDTIKLPYPAVMRFYLPSGYPALTGRRAPFKAANGELVGFIRGVTSAFDFRGLGCKFWDQNANENAQWLANAFRKGTDDLGDVYGAQWRRWPAFKLLKPTDFPSSDAHVAAEAKLEADGWKRLEDHSGRQVGLDEDIWFKEIDQLAECVRKIILNPSDRRILFHAWNPAKLDEIALPACHLLYQFVPTPSKKELALSVTIRSNDMPLGFPSNVMEAATLLELVARLTGYKATWLTIISNDAHIYRNQMDMVNEYLERPVQDLPKLVISDRVPTYLDMYDNVLDGVMACENDPHTPLPRERANQMIADAAVAWLDKVEPTDFSLEGYTPGEPISAPMAV